VPYAAVFHSERMPNGESKTEKAKLLVAAEER
jgi:hypothetical protein